MHIPIRIVQALAIILALCMVLNFVFLIMQRISWTNFWILTGIIGAAAVWGIPRLRKAAAED